MPKILRQALSSAVLFLALFALSLPAWTACAFADDAVSLTADRSEVKAGETVNVTVHLTGNAIWAYQIDLSANEMFAGDQTLIEDHDGSDSVTVTVPFFALTPGNGEICAEAAYSDGDRQITLKDTAIPITVTEAEEGPAIIQKAGKEGTGGQAVGGQTVNGYKVPKTPDPQTEEAENGTSAKKGTAGKQNGAEPGTEQESLPGQTEEAKPNGTVLWIVIGAVIVLLLAGGALLAVRKKRKSNRP